MPKPAKNARKRGLRQIPEMGQRNVETMRLFDLKLASGWWPVAGTDDGDEILVVCHSTYDLY